MAACTKPTRTRLLSVPSSEAAEEDDTAIIINTSITRHKCSCLLLLVLNVALAILIGLEILYWVNDELPYTPNAQICVPCQALTLHPDDTVVNVLMSQRNASLCCVEDDDKLQSMVEQLVARRVYLRDVQDERPIEPCAQQAEDEIEELYPSINVVGRQEKTEIDLSQAFTPLTWDIKSHLQHQNGPISYVGGYIKIEKGGVYNIYAQVTFNETNPGAKPPNSLAIYKWQFSEADEEMIADSRHSECPAVSDTLNRGETVTEKHVTSYVSIVNYLDKGEHVRVQVHTPEGIVAGPHLNFFGMHMIR